MSSIIRPAKASDAQSLSELVCRVTRPFLGTDLTEEGWAFNVAYNQPENIQKQLQQANYLSLCYLKDDEIVGVISVLDFQSISQLFVASEHRNQGIAKSLWSAARQVCKQAGQDKSYFVKSSTFAVSVYESFGFKVVGAPQMQNGIKYIPMRYESTV